MAKSHNVDVHVGTRVRQRRTLLAMSQTKLGDAVGLTFQQIQKYEHGGNRISASALFKIAAALSVDVSYFFEGAPGVQPKPNASGPLHRSFSSPSDPLASPMAIKMVHGFLRIADRDLQKDLYRLVKRLADKSD